MTPFCIRPAKIEDCSDIMKLIQELADYEKMPDGPKLSLSTFEKDGFGKQAFYKCYVAEVSEMKSVVGYALYHYAYSTWEGKSIYLEDLYVTPKYRKQGIGESLWKAVAEEGIKTECCFMQFVCLGWNISSLEFYKRRGVQDITSKEEYHLLRLKRDEMSTFVNSKKTV